MPTFVHKDSGKKVFFAHIPRTAGRFVESSLLENNFEWGDSHLDNGYGLMSIVNGYEIAHYHRPWYEKYLDVKGIPHFSIVRNPIDRFISGSIYLKRSYGDNIQSVMEDLIMFPSMITNLPLEGALNWYRPQVQFLRNDTHIWKFEDGMNEQFFEWLSDIVGVKLIFNKNAKYPKSKDEGNKLKKTPALSNNVKNFYNKDIEYLYPELLL